MADATIVRCSALVFGPDGQVLLVRRNRGPDPDYVLPGGTPRPGESLGACARREVREETGLEVDPVRVAFILETADGISGATVDVVFTADVADESQTAGPLRAVEEGLCPEFVDLDRLGGLRLLPPIAGHIRGFARDRHPATIPILGNLWRSHLGSSRARVCYRSVG